MRIPLSQSPDDVGPRTLQYLVYFVLGKNDTSIGLFVDFLTHQRLVLKIRSCFFKDNSVSYAYIHGYIPALEGNVARFRPSVKFIAQI